MLDLVIIDVLNQYVFRWYALVLHFFLTTVLLWTKIDSIQVSIYYLDNAGYSTANYQYEGMIVSAIVILILRAFFLILEGNRLSLAGSLVLMTDVLACFFVAWIILDGLIWTTYGYVFFFCV